VTRSSRVTIGVLVDSKLAIDAPRKRNLKLTRPGLADTGFRGTNRGCGVSMMGTEGTKGAVD